jgi:two-component system, cell cycle sensor histidine kinase and response regulator CckA
LTDMVMPGGITGRQLIDQLRAERPKLKVVYISGYSVELNDEDYAFRADTFFVPKPFAPEHLLRIIRDCLDGVENPQERG